MYQKIKHIIQRIPAGSILLPLMAGALVRTFAPGILELGAFTTALLSSNAAATLIGVQLFCLGAQLKIRELKNVLRLGGTLLLPKLLAGFLCAGLFLLAAPAKTILGISALSAVAAVSNINGSLYLSLASLFERKTDMACTPLLALSNGPFFTLLILGLSGLSEFPFRLLLATILPMLLGMIGGNVSVKLADKLKPGVSLLLPFIGFSLGAGMDLKNALQGGASGLLLAVFVLALALLSALLMKRLVKGSDGYAALISGATGANAVAIPAAVALIDPTWEAYASGAAAQLVSCALLCALLIPFLAELWHKKTAQEDAPVTETVD